MVSSMLTAIRDFVADSFKVEEDEGLETIRVGELYACGLNRGHWLFLLWS